MNDFVPGRSLLSSSASSCGGDPTHKERFPGIDLGLDGLLEVVFGKLGAEIWEREEVISGRERKHKRIASASASSSHRDTHE